MKPQRFEIGQAITPKVKAWGDAISGLPLPSPDDPEFGKVYHVRSYWPYGGEWWICLNEVNEDNAFLETNFEPLITDSVLAEALSEVPESVNLDIV